MIPVVLNICSFSGSSTRFRQGEGLKAWWCSVESLKRSIKRVEPRPSGATQASHSRVALA